MNHFASKFVVIAQDNLMQARDERISLMNEVGLVHDTLKFIFMLCFTFSQVLGGIRMLKACGDNCVDYFREP